VISDVGRLRVDVPSPKSSLTAIYNIQLSGIDKTHKNI